MMRFRDLKIGKKIFVGFLVSGVITFAVGYFGLSSMKIMNTDSQKMYDESVEPLVQLIYLIEEVEQIHLTMAEAMSASAYDEIRHKKEEIQQAREQVDLRIASFESMRQSDKIKEEWQAFRSNWLAFGETIPVFFRLLNEGNTVDARAYEGGKVKELALGMRESINNVVGIEESHASHLNAEVGATYNLVRIEILILLGGGIGLTFVAAYFFSRIISRPVKQLEQAAKELAAGNTSVQLEVKSKDEIGSMMDSFNVMVKHMVASAESIYMEKHKVEVEKSKVEQTVRDTEKMRQYLSRSVSYMLEGMGRFAKGDLTVKLESEKKGDEISKLYDGFNSAMANIRELFIQVRRTVDETVLAAIQISSATEQLSTGVQQQSEEAFAVSSAVEKMTQTIIANAQNATETAEVAKRNGDVARDGGNVVEQTVGKIRQIADHVSMSAKKVERLGASSEEIGQIVETIYEIADQTNLLALNAAIEAARAGEQGRGFAVVADEVRKLAERTSGATRQIAEMIQTIQEDTLEAVKTMQQGKQEVEQGIALADEAGSALNRILNETEATIGLVNQIAYSSEQQSHTSEQISMRVESISTVSEESAQGVGDIARSVDNLNQLMDEVKVLVSRFQVENTKVPVAQENMLVLA